MNTDPLDEWDDLLSQVVDDGEPAESDDGPEEFRFRPSDTILFTGDQGTLTYEARSVLTAILKRNYLSADQHTKLWPLLLKHRYDVESRLNDLFLTLVCDTDAGIAYKVQVPGTRFPTLMSTQNRAYTWTETILLRHLRETYANELGRDGNANVVISKTEMVERLQADKSIQRNDEKKQRENAEKAFERIESAGILVSTRDTGADRYRISPVIVPLISLDKLKALSAYLDTLDADDTVEPTDTDGEIAAVDLSPGEGSDDDLD